MTAVANILKELSEAASFTYRDMAVWCECDYSAVRQWSVLGVEPHPLRKKHLTQRLELLRRFLKKKPDILPVPLGVNQYDRKKYVEDARDYALGKLSKAGASK